MKIKFHLTNTSARSYRISCLDRPLRIAPGATAVVDIDEWRFKHRGEFARMLGPYFAEGLVMSVETDCEMFAGEAPKRFTLPPNHPANRRTEYREPERFHSMKAGSPRVVTGSPLPNSDRERFRPNIGGSVDGAAALASSRTMLPEDMAPKPQEIKRMPGANDPLQAPPARPGLSAETPEIVAKASDLAESMRADALAALAARAEIEQAAADKANGARAARTAAAGAGTGRQADAPANPEVPAEPGADSPAEAEAPAEPEAGVPAASNKPRSRSRKPQAPAAEPRIDI